MSKSLWIPTEDGVLPVHKDQRVSETVLFWIEGEKAPSWGFYDYTMKEWRTTYGPETSIIPSAEVKYFAYIDNPYK